MCFYMTISNNFKNYFSGIKNELENKTTGEASQEYYGNAVKDLTQPQRTNLLKILKGEVGPTQQDAEEIVTVLEAYKKAYDSASDKKAYITVRNPPRERSWYKSIARFFSNWGSRVSSSEVLDAITEANFKKINTEDNKIMGDWLSQFQDNFLAHAVYAQANSVLQAGSLKPAEMILREGAEVEFEQGTQGSQRGRVRLPTLAQEDMVALQKALFSDKDQSRLDEILRDQTTLATGKAKYKEFSALRKELHATKPKSRFEAPRLDDNKTERLYTLAEAIEDKTDAEINLYLEYTELQRKREGLRALLRMKDKTSVPQSYPNEDFTTKFAASDLIRSLAEKYNCAERDILIAFDLAQPQEKRIDTYLRKKFNKGIYGQNILAQLREDVLRIQKLNQEIRMSINDIYWAYGDVVILMGGDKSKVRKELGSEAMMDSPITGDDFYSINLKTTNNLLILGPRKDLEAFKKDYGDRIVYIEDLSLAQMDALKVPDNLR